MSFCLPSHVTASCTCLEWPLYRRTRFATSRIALASLENPSTFKTKIGCESYWSGTWFAVAYSESMKLEVSLQSTSPALALVLASE
jgi:hypothetical protein